MAKTKVQNRSTKSDPVIRAIPKACADEKAAVEFMEKQRWAGRPCCPRCGSENVYQMTDSKTGERQKNWRWRCRDCAKAKATAQFTVRTGTVFEDSRIELRHWCFGFWRAATSEKGVSALEIHRQTGISYKSALFMLHRIRFAMAPAYSGQLNGDVEVDETFVGGKPRYKGKSKRGHGDKQPVVALVQRDGEVRTKVVPDVTGKTLKAAIREYVHPDSRILTDEHGAYIGIDAEYKGGHETIKHKAREYARGDVTTNTVEGFFSIFKRGLNGVYHSVSRKHLHRYMAEFEFRYNRRELEDGQRNSYRVVRTTRVELAWGQRFKAHRHPKPVRLTNSATSALIEVSGSRVVRMLMLTENSSPALGHGCRVSRGAVTLLASSLVYT